MFYSLYFAGFLKVGWMIIAFLDKAVLEFLLVGDSWRMQYVILLSWMSLVNKKGDERNEISYFFLFYIILLLLVIDVEVWGALEFWNSSHQLLTLWGALLASDISPNVAHTLSSKSSHVERLESRDRQTPLGMIQNWLNVCVLSQQALWKSPSVFWKFSPGFCNVGGLCSLVFICRIPIS